ncbi:MAG: orotidine-5'-phosphate decarboxylase [Bacteroidia bacterium]|nr:orotidine-5'-phosphate decarboxylase [Bacteroidia bacterium]MCF8426349.1 orotidine-5'-phosphate decarboxylase [Bacteroidia bacterium]MCF8445752.1 orotidine-5'-phosphate decarboxylase [Bacteroidia bacterium]
MYSRSKLIEEITNKKSFLCVGLDTDITKIPKHLLSEPDPVFAFNKAIIDATSPLCVAYKINTAFFEADGAKGWESMQKTFDYIPKDCLSIADAKRGDIGNTSHQYAKAFFETLNADSVTLAPYMGNDSIAPFFKYPGKWGIVLALTSNPGSADYEQQKIGDKFLFEHVLENTCEIGSEENLMFVVGATKPQEFSIIRKHAPNHFLLVPGVGAQGGSLSDVVKYGKIKDIGLLINASRSIIYASNGHDFADFAASEARKIQEEMATYL